MQINNTKTILLSPDEQEKLLGYKVYSKWAVPFIKDENGQLEIEADYDEIRNKLRTYATKHLGDEWKAADLEIIPQSAAPEFKSQVVTVLKLICETTSESNLDIHYALYRGYNSFCVVPVYKIIEYSGSELELDITFTGTGDNDVSGQPYLRLKSGFATYNDALDYQLKDNEKLH